MNSGVSCAQDMMYDLRVLELLELQVKPPMLLEIDNSGTVHLKNNWIVGGRTHHIETQHQYIHKLKEGVYLVVNLISGEENKNNVFTKNSAGPVFNLKIMT